MGGMPRGFRTSVIDPWAPARRGQAGTNDLYAQHRPPPSVLIVRSWRARIAAAVSLIALIALAVGVWAWRTGIPSRSAPMIAAPSMAGLNYGVPRTVSGEWVGTQWLRSESSGGYWESTRPALQADLDFIQQHRLGKVMRVFVGLDEAMSWDPATGFKGFEQSALQNFSAALDMFDAHGMRVLAVLYDQQETGSSGNFHFEALDGAHPAMRQGYLRAADQFLGRFGARHTVIGWDLFNEPYNSLAQDGHLPAPPHDNPVSPNFSDQTVHDWMRDLYRTAKAASPTALFTFSDTTELYWNPLPDLAKYSDAVDFYDIHVYDDHPSYPNWRWILNKPYVVGEAGASTTDSHYENQALNSSAVAYLLDHEAAAGVSFVLAQGPAFSEATGFLTPTGAAVATFLTKNPTKS